MNKPIACSASAIRHGHMLLFSHAVTTCKWVSRLKYIAQVSTFNFQIYCMRVWGRVAQSVTCLSIDVSLTADPGVSSLIPARSHTFVEIDSEIISTVILSLQLNHSRRVVVSYKQKYMCTKYWLTACSSLPRKKCGYVNGPPCHDHSCWLGM